MDSLPQPKNRGQPWPAQDAAFVNSGRSGIGCLLLGFFLLLFFTGCAVAGAIWPEAVLTDVDPGTGQIICGVIAAVFGLMTLFMLLALPAALRTHGLAVDRSGLWYVDRDAAEFIDWRNVRAVGASFTMSKRAPATSIGSMAGKAITEKAMTDNGRQFFAVEIFLHDPRAAASGQKLRSVTVEGEPPNPGLPPQRLRFMIRGIGDYRDMAGYLYRCAPALWVGEYKR